MTAIDRSAKSSGTFLADEVLQKFSDSTNLCTLTDAGSIGLRTDAYWALRRRCSIATLVRSALAGQQIH